MAVATNLTLPTLPPGKLHLKYLFGVHFEDGTEMFQTQDDTSSMREGRPANYDFLEHDEKGECIVGPAGWLLTRSDIQLFMLEGNGFQYIVDLRDGHFEIATYPVGKNKSMRQPPFFISIPPPDKKLRLVYFKRRRHSINVSGTVQEDGSVLAHDSIETGQECEYHFGWITEDGSERALLILV